MTGADLSQLNGRRIDREIALAMGWVLWAERRGGYDHIVWQRAGEPEPWMREQSSYQAKAQERYSPLAVADIDAHHHIPEHDAMLPKFSTSLDALQQPEKVLMDAGWWLTVRRDKSGTTARWENDATYFHGYCDTEAEARARACLDALICEGAV